MYVISKQNERTNTAILESNKFNAGKNKLEITNKTLQGTLDF